MASPWVGLTPKFTCKGTRYERHANRGPLLGSLVRGNDHYAEDGEEHRRAAGVLVQRRARVLSSSALCSAASKTDCTRAVDCSARTTSRQLDGRHFSVRNGQVRSSYRKKSRNSAGTNANFVHRTAPAPAAIALRRPCNATSVPRSALARRGSGERGRTKANRASYGSTMMTPFWPIARCGVQ